jgi:hypothetical protein
MMRVFLALALISVPATSGDQFDLVCTGTQTALESLQRSPITRRYHVDLKAGRWCANECPLVKGFAEVRPEHIVFEEAKPAYRGDPSEHLEFVRRDTGNWSYFGYGAQADGSCQIAPFTPFPSRGTKF